MPCLPPRPNGVRIGASLRKRFNGVITFLFPCRRGGLRRSKAEQSDGRIKASTINGREYGLEYGEYCQRDVAEHRK